MKSKFYLLIAIVVSVLTLAAAGSAAAWSAINAKGANAMTAAVGSKFTYQGFLSDSGNPVSGPFDFQFKLYDASVSGAQIGSTNVFSDVSVTNGRFTVLLDFGVNAFDGNARYLDISVRDGASTGAYTLLAPRTELTSAPYSQSSGALYMNDGVDASVEAAFRVNGDNAEIVEPEDLSAPPQSSQGGNVWLTFEDGGSTASANVGIGETNPVAKLHIRADDYRRAIFLDGGAIITSGSLTTKWNLPTSPSGNAVLSIISNDWDTANGFGLIRGGNVAAPVAWMYSSSGRNAFTVARKNYAGTGEDVTTIDQYLVPLLQVREDGDVGIGTTNPGAKLDVNGTTRSKIIQITGGSDVAERFNINSDVDLKPGMLVSIDPDQPGELRVSDRAYDRTVAGCISGANGINPGLVIEQENSIMSGEYPVALTGRVYCYADATYGPIEPGDLLTTSDTPGYMMAVTDYDRAHGAIIGKAMTGSKSGRGLILVLVTLQ